MLENIKKLILKKTYFYRFFQNLLISNSYFLIYEKLTSIIESNYKDFCIYDLGCGDAPLAKYLSKNMNYIGIDINNNHIKTARKKYPYFEFKCSDLESFSITDKKGFFILDGVVHHLANTQVLELISKLEAVEQHAIFCKDPIYTDNQDTLSHLLMKNDGGSYIRDEKGYRDVLKGFNFGIYDSLLRIPYQHIISTKNFEFRL